MRTLLSIVAAATLSGCVAMADEPGAAAKAPGIRWETTLDAACARAKLEGKLVLLLQLHGDFEKELC